MEVQEVLYIHIIFRLNTHRQPWLSACIVCWLSLTAHEFMQVWNLNSCQIRCPRASFATGDQKKRRGARISLHARNLWTSNELPHRMLISMSHKLTFSCSFHIRAVTRQILPWKQGLDNSDEDTFYVDYRSTALYHFSRVRMLRYLWNLTSVWTSYFSKYMPWWAPSQLWRLLWGWLL